VADNSLFFKQVEQYPNKLAIMKQYFDALTFDRIDINKLFSSLRSPVTGGIVMFSGEVRNINKGRSVLYLEYEAYEHMAQKRIHEITAYAIQHWELNNALCVHRLGRLEISDCAIIVLTASMHRAQAYNANRYIIDTVKHEVPIWKKEYFTDGTFEWGNNCACADQSVLYQHVK
jgi:molybdopterin synthase catalytic subunit